MRVGVDGACLANGRGYGRFTRELLTELVAVAPDLNFVVFLDAAARAVFALEGANVAHVEVAQRVAPTEAAAADGHRSLRDMLAFSRAVAREELDVFFSPSIYTYFPLPPRLTGVVGVHDTIAERHPELTLPSRRARLFWSAKVRFALWQCHTVMTVSDFSAREVSEVLGVRPERIRVVSEAASSAFWPSPPDEVAASADRLGLPPGARWVVYVGGFGPHKNVEDVVRAHAAANRTSGGRLHLLLVGTLDGDSFLTDRVRILRAVEDEGTESLVRWTGFVPDDELRPLLSGAIALVLPSEREGFGLTAVEAAACGTPVIATVCSPLPTLLAGGGFFVEPRDVPTFARSLAALAADDELRARMGRTAHEQAARLTWRAAADAAARVIREAAQ